MKEPKLDNARRLRSIYFIDPDDWECTEALKKNAPRKIEVPMDSAYVLQEKEKVKQELIEPASKNERKLS